MGFARCGVEGNLREFSEITRKKLFHFLVFSYFLKMEKVFARDRSPLEISVAVARTSQSPFPLCAILPPRLSNKIYEIFLL